MKNDVKNNNENIVRNFIDSFAKADFAKMLTLLDEHLVAYITNAQSNVDKVLGSEEYLRRIRSMDISSAHLKIEIKQITDISQDQTLVMVEVQASRGNKSLHNFAAHLIKIKNNKISEMWMVEALPAYSEEFWSTVKKD